MAQLMPLPDSLSLALVKSRLVFTFLVPAHPGSPGQRVVKRMCVIQILILASLQLVHSVVFISGDPMGGRRSSGHMTAAVFQMHAGDNC